MRLGRWSCSPGGRAGSWEEGQFDSTASSVGSHFVCDSWQHRCAAIVLAMTYPRRGGRHHASRPSRSSRVVEVKKSASSSIQLHPRDETCNARSGCLAVIRDRWLVRVFLTFTRLSCDATSRIAGSRGTQHVAFVLDRTETSLRPMFNFTTF